MLDNDNKDNEAKAMTICALLDLIINCSSPCSNFNSQECGVSYIQLLSFQVTT